MYRVGVDGTRAKGGLVIIVSERFRRFDLSVFSRLRVLDRAIFDRVDEGEARQVGAVSTRLMGVVLLLMLSCSRPSSE